MPPINQLLLDRQTAHALGLSRLQSGIARDALRIFDDGELELLAVFLGIRGTASRTRLERALRDAARVNTEAYAAAYSALRGFVAEAGAYELDFQRRMAEGLTGRYGLEWSIPAVVALEDRAVIQGLHAQDWLKGQEQARRIALRRTVDRWLREGDGRLETLVPLFEAPLRKARNHYDTVARSWVGNATAMARDLFYTHNDDHVEGMIWNGVLDSRITPHLCLPRDGKFYTLPDHRPIGHDLEWGPGPGRLHPRCRSTGSPVLRKWGELALNEQAIPPDFRETFDGQVPRVTDAETWLRGQPIEVIEDVFGVTKARLFKYGGLTAEDMIRPNTLTPLTIDELRTLEAGAFSRAGL